MMRVARSEVKDHWLKCSQGNVEISLRDLDYNAGIGSAFLHHTTSS
jgi:hypothetical protein